MNRRWWIMGGALLGAAMVPLLLGGTGLFERLRSFPGSLLAMMLGSAGAAALNLIALTLAASRVELASLDLILRLDSNTPSLRIDALASHRAA